MSRLMHKSVHISKYTIPALLLLALVIGTVAATVYVVLQFTAEATVQPNPKVCFWQWPGGPKENNFTEAFNIFPNVRTIDDNATYGIFCDDTVGHTCYLRISAVTAPANIEEVYIKVYNATATVVEITASGPTDFAAGQFTAVAGAKYSIHIEVKATAVASESSTITFELKVENP